MLHYLKRLFIYRKKDDAVQGVQSPNEEPNMENKENSSSLKLKHNKDLIMDELQHLMQEQAKILHAKSLGPGNESLHNKHLEINRKIKAFAVLHEKYLRETKAAFS